MCSIQHGVRCLWYCLNANCLICAPCFQGFLHEALLDQFAGTNEASGQAVHTANVSDEHVLAQRTGRIFRKTSSKWARERHHQTAVKAWRLEHLRSLLVFANTLTKWRNLGHLRERTSSKHYWSYSVLDVSALSSELAIEVVAPGCNAALFHHDEHRE